MRPGTPPARILHRLLDAIPPASGAVVMGTGIVSVALLLDGQHVLSRILLVVDAGTWVALAVLFFARALGDRARFRADGRNPAALTSIAGTAVLGTRLTLAGWNWAGVTLLVIALLTWLGLVPMANGRSFSDGEAREIGKRIGIDWSTARFDVDQFRRGLEVEPEHGRRDPATNVSDDDELTTGRIAWAHLNEFPDYYTRLARMEAEAEQYWADRGPGSAA